MRTYHINFNSFTKSAGELMLAGLFADALKEYSYKFVPRVKPSEDNFYDIYYGDVKIMHLNEAAWDEVHSGIGRLFWEGCELTAFIKSL